MEAEEGAWFSSGTAHTRVYHDTEPAGATVYGSRVFFDPIYQNFDANATNPSYFRERRPYQAVDAGDAEIQAAAVDIIKRQMYRVELELDPWWNFLELVSGFSNTSRERLGRSLTTESRVSGSNAAAVAGPPTSPQDANPLRSPSLMRRRDGTQPPRVAGPSADGPPTTPAPPARREPPVPPVPPPKPGAGQPSLPPGLPPGVANVIGTNRVRELYRDGSQTRQDLEELFSRQRVAETAQWMLSPEHIGVLQMSESMRAALAHAWTLLCDRGRALGWPRSSIEQVVNSADGELVTHFAFLVAQCILHTRFLAPTRSQLDANGARITALINERAAYIVRHYAPPGVSAQPPPRKRTLYARDRMLARAPDAGGIAPLDARTLAARPWLAKNW